MSSRFAAAVLAGIAIAVAWILWARGERPVLPPTPTVAADEPTAAKPDATTGTVVPADREGVPPAASRAATLRGTIRVAETKAPVAGGTIVAAFVDCAAHGLDPASLVDRDREDLRLEEQSCAVAAGGAYEIVVPERAFLVAFTIEPPGAVDVPGVRLGVRFDAFERGELVVREAIAGPEWLRDLEVSLGARLTGFVVDRVAGTPVPSALVRCVNADAPFETFGAHTAVTGAFEVTGLPMPAESNGETWEICATGVGFQEQTLTVRSSAPAPTQVVIELERAVVLRGRVVDPMARGVASIEVSAVGNSAEPTPFGRSLEFVQSTTTAADGSFSFSIPGTESVALRAEGNYPVSTPNTSGWGVGALTGIAATRDVLDLVIELQPTAAFRVRGVDRDGAAVADDGMVVLVKTADGWRRAGVYFRAAQGIEHEICVYAPAPAGAATAPGAALRGCTTCLPVHAKRGVHEVRVALVPWQFEIPPALTAKVEGERPPSLAVNSGGPHARFVRDLCFVDAVTGERLSGRRFEFREGRSAGASTTSTFGRARLELAPGLVDLTIHLEGYRPRAFRIDNPVTGYEETEVRFRK